MSLHHLSAEVPDTMENLGLLWKSRAQNVIFPGSRWEVVDGRCKLHPYAARTRPSGFVSLLGCFVAVFVVCLVQYPKHGAEGDIHMAKTVEQCVLNWIYPRDANIYMD